MRLLAAALAFLAASPAFAAEWGDEPEAVQGRSTESPRAKKAREEFGAYAAQLGMPAPPFLLEEKEAKGQPIGGADQWRAEYDGYQAKLAACTLHGADAVCNFKEPPSGSLTTAQFKAAADRAGLDLPAKARWLCGLADSSVGYFHYYSSDKTPEAYRVIGRLTVGSSNFSAGPLIHYARMFEELYGVKIECSYNGCWLKSECESKVVKQAELLQQKRDQDERERQAKAKRAEDSKPVKTKGRPEPAKAKEYEYRAVGGASLGKWLSWQATDEGLAAWWDCNGPKPPHAFGDSILRRKTGLRYEYLVHPSYPAASTGSDACEKAKELRKHNKAFPD
jgi:hypothetical protein